MVLLVDRSDHEMIWLPDGDEVPIGKIFDLEPEIDANVRLESPWILSC
jgi:hypothetical protein